MEGEIPGGGSNALGESSKGNEYQKEIDDLKNYSDLNEKERDRLLSIKKFDLQTAHAYHFKIAMVRIRKVNVTIAEPI